MPSDDVPCWIYRSPRQDEMYLYITAEGAFDHVPPDLLERFGTPKFVMQLHLHSGRPLAREAVTTVIRELRECGFHLQLPPRVNARLYQGD